jgi:NAD(P)-dependent dehydrogenase (short-subunit alcohol dehydrogenase family)
MNMDSEFEGKVGLITGGGGRLGSFFGEVLAENNRIYLLDREAPPCDLGGNLAFCECDIRDENVVNDVFENIRSSNDGRIDFLINCAALQITKPFEKMSVTEFRDSIDVNLNSAYICIKAVSDAMIQQKKGVIVNIGSIYGVVSADPAIYGSSGLNSPDAYAASKGGLIHLTKYLAANLASHGIRVNCLSPGGVFNNQPDEFLEKYAAKCPMRRMVNREELIGPLKFLLSDASSCVTGHNLIVDGGFTII